MEIFPVLNLNPSNDIFETLFKDFYWQTGYAAFSVSYSQLPRIKNYIVTQEEHHKKYSFERELETLLTLNDINYQRQYLWD